MMARFQPGELVDVTIRGARVSDRHTQDKHLHLYVGDETFHLPARLLDRATVTRVAPAEWPPQPGDVWEDASGVEWFARRDREALDGIWLIADETGTGMRTTDLLANRGPVALVRRKGWSPTPAADVEAEPERPGEGRAAIVTGLRQLADLIEQTSVPVPSVLHLGQSTNWYYDESGYRAPSDEDAIGRVQAWADALGVEARSREVGSDTIHHNADGRLAGLAVEMSYIQRKPAVVTPPAGDAPAVTVAETAGAPEGIDITPLLLAHPPGPVTFDSLAAVAGVRQAVEDEPAVEPGPDVPDQPDVDEADPHADCDPSSRAGTEQTCDRCGRTLTVTPSTDFYCAAEGDHCCEPCLIDGRPLVVVEPASDVAGDRTGEAV